MITVRKGRSHLAALAFVLAMAGAAAACGSGTSSAVSSEAGPPDADTNEAAATDANPAADAATGGDAAVADAPSDAAAGGSCLAARTITLPFAVDTVASTAGQLDTTSVACGAPTGLPELVYRLVLTQPTSVTVNASDRSGQGIGVQVRQDSCSGTSVGCDWASNGLLARTYASLPAGTWLFIVERNPAGLITFSLTP